MSCFFAARPAPLGSGCRCAVASGGGGLDFRLGRPRLVLPPPLTPPASDPRPASRRHRPFARTRVLRRGKGLRVTSRGFTSLVSSVLFTSLVSSVLFTSLVSSAFFPPRLPAPGLGWLRRRRLRRARRRRPRGKGRRRRRRLLGAPPLSPSPRLDLPLRVASPYPAASPSRRFGLRLGALRSVASAAPAAGSARLLPATNRLRFGPSPAAGRRSPVDPLRLFAPELAPSPFGVHSFFSPAAGASRKSRKC